MQLLSFTPSSSQTLLELHLYLRGNHQQLSRPGRPRGSYVFQGQSLDHMQPTHVLLGQLIRALGGQGRLNSMVHKINKEVCILRTSLPRANAVPLGAFTSRGSQSGQSHVMHTLPLLFSLRCSQRSSNATMIIA